jgi:hypothetical protein
MGDREAMMRIDYLVYGCIVATGCVAKNDDIFTQAQARNAGDALAGGIEESAKSYGPVTTGAGVDAQCVTLSGDTSDADGDSIPANAMLTFNCTDMLLGYTGMLTGTEALIDNQAAAVAWAFTATADLHGVLTGPGGASITQDRDGQIIASQATAVGPFALARKLDVVTVFKGENGATATVTEDNDWTVTFTPMATWTPGGIAVTGSLSATGSWNVTVNDASAAATLSTPTPLTLNPTCATRVTAGTIKGSFVSENRTADLTVTWTACGVRNVVYVETGMQLDGSGRDV